MLSNDKRATNRQAVLKTAKVEWRDSLLDCLVLEQSLSGLRIGTSIPMNFPEQVIIHLRGGAARAATQRWARGTEIGFEFGGGAKLDAVAANDALALLIDLHEAGINGIIARMAEARFFDDMELSSIALSAQAAIQRLEVALRRRAEGGEM